MASAWADEFGDERVRFQRVDMYDLPAFAGVLDEIAGQEQVDILVNNAYELGPNTGFNSMDGSIDVTSRPGEGTRFVVTLPAATG